MNDKSAMTEAWVFACEFDSVGREDVKRWDHNGHSFAIFRSSTDTVYATDNVCTHEHAFLSDGYVEGETIECPRHSGRFNYKTGEPRGAPVCIDLQTYQVKVEGGKVYVLIR